jgi:hypothetical protein
LLDRFRKRRHLQFQRQLRDELGPYDARLARELEDDFARDFRKLLQVQRGGISERIVAVRFRD